MNVVVVGLGYVGLPVARGVCGAGLRCTGLDADRRRVDQLLAARSHVDDVTDADVAAMLAQGFTATDDPSCVATADAIVVCVPTPLDEDQLPDLGAVNAVAEAIAPHLATGSLVVLESTTYPGTTDGPFREMLEAGSGKLAGVDFALAFSPERIDPGNPTWGLHNTPKVVGGLTPTCTERAADFYGRFVESVHVTRGPREAELAKLIENTYRHVNIALMNEIAIFCHELDIDVWAAIDAAASKPFGFQSFQPGPGVGGHCIPIDPSYLSYKVRRLGYQFRFVELAQEINGRMPSYVVARVQELLNGQGRSVLGACVAVVGVTYKPDVADDRETPARPIIERLVRLGARVVAIDPHVERFQVGETAIDIAVDPIRAAAECDVLLVLQHHRALDLDAMCAVAPSVFDTRGRRREDHAVTL